MGNWKAQPHAVHPPHRAELCSLSPRQALSLLFDTFHNEVDAFLAAEVSAFGGAASSPRGAIPLCSCTDPPHPWGLPHTQEDSTATREWGPIFLWTPAAFAVDFFHL